MFFSLKTRFLIVIIRRWWRVGEFLGAVVGSYSTQHFTAENENIVPFPNRFGLLSSLLWQMHFRWCHVILTLFLQNVSLARILSLHRIHIVLFYSVGYHYTWCHVALTLCLQNVSFARFLYFHRIHWKKRQSTFKVWPKFVLSRCVLSFNRRKLETCYGFALISGSCLRR